MTPSFTAHIGLRWEFYGRLPICCITKPSPGKRTLPPPSGTCLFRLVCAAVPYVQPVYHNYQPRLGFAWNPDFNKNLVISAGDSINTDPEFTNPFLNAAQSSPVANAGVVGCPCQPASGSFTSAATRAVLLPSLPTRRESAVSTIRVTCPLTSITHIRRHTPWRGVSGRQSVVISARYVGAHTVGNFQSVDANPLFVAGSHRPFPITQIRPLSSGSTQPRFGRPDCTYSNRAIVNNRPVYLQRNTTPT